MRNVFEGKVANGIAFAMLASWAMEWNAEGKVKFEGLFRDSNCGLI
jgi:hypothetical protein